MVDPKPGSDEARALAETGASVRASVRASDLSEIRRLEDRLAFATDAGDWQAFLECFEADATGDYGALGSGPIAGIVDAIAESQGRYLGTMNFVGTHDASWQGDRAVARTYVVSHHFRGEGRGEGGAGVQADDHVGTCYADRFVKRSGVWKIAHREARVLWFRQDEVHGGWL